MEPYQEAAQEIKSQGERPINFAKKAIGTGVAASTAYLGGSAVNRVLPFLSKYIPESLFTKGLSKVDPRFGKFIEGAMSAGKTVDEIKDFIGEKFSEEGGPLDPSKQHRSIIEQYSPELYQFLKGEIGKGRSPTQAGALAKNDKKFLNIIKKISKDHKTDWSAIIESVFGIGQKAQPGSEQSRREGLSQFNQKMKSPSMREQERERFQNEYGQQQQQSKSDTGLKNIGNMASGMMGNFYDQIFQALSEGKDTMSGVKDPLLQLAKPAFDAGQIKSPDDLKAFAKFYSQKKQMPQKGQGEGALMSILQKINQARGG